jgi:hypothetical protein
MVICRLIAVSFASENELDAIMFTQQGCDWCTC